MNDNDIFDLTRTMEGLIDEGLQEIDIMRQLLMVAESAHSTSQYTQFRIGADTYSLADLNRIQELEEYEGLVERHRSRR